MEPRLLRLEQVVLRHILTYGMLLRGVKQHKLQLGFVPEHTRCRLQIIRVACQQQQLLLLAEGLWQTLLFQRQGHIVNRRPLQHLLLWIQVEPGPEQE